MIARMVDDNENVHSNAGADTAVLIEQFLQADSRARKKLLPELRPRLDRDGVIAIAETVRDPSPRISSRVTSLLARHGLDELFESQLTGLKPGKIDILRRHFDRLRRDTAADSARPDQPAEEDEA